MKIERINDNQFRCTLTRSDLADRELKLSELAYGSEKAHHLFDDLLEKAFNELGFEVNDSPLMVEAIPLSSECLILIVTKVDDPEELDTRFSNFTTPSETEDDSETSIEDAGEIFDLFSQLRQNIENLVGSSSGDDTPVIEEIRADAPSAGTDIKPASKGICTCMLDSLDSAGDLACRFPEDLKIDTALYKQPETGRYLLLISELDDQAEAYRQACILCSEFGQMRKINAVSRRFFNEHYETIIRKNALEVLRSI